METLNIIIRGEVIGASILIATTLFIQRPYEQISWATAGLVFALLSEIAVSFVDQGMLPSHLRTPLYIGSASTPLFFAWFVLVVFNDTPFSFRHPPKGGIALLACASLAFLLSPTHVFFKWPAALCQGFGILTFLGSAVIVLASAKDDLVDRRRNARMVFVTTLGLFGAFVMGAELLTLTPQVEMWISLFKGTMIFIFLIVAAMFLFQPFNEIVQKSNPKPPSNQGGDVSDWIEVKIEKLMDDGVWAEEGLAIAGLADRVGAPEYLVRRTINQRMGFKNFPTFVNSYRIKAAQKMLADPDQSRKSVLEIAYEVGFASLGPFNKAFKDFAETTPTEFRRHAFGHHSSISENLH